MTSEEIPAIEILPPLVTKHWETQGGPITIFRLRLLSPQQIAAHGLEKYMPKEGEENAE